MIFGGFLITGPIILLIMELFRLPSLCHPGSVSLVIGLFLVGYLICGIHLFLLVFHRICCNIPIFTYNNLSLVFFLVYSSKVCQFYSSFQRINFWFPWFLCSFNFHVIYFCYGIIFCVLLDFSSYF